MDPSFRSRAIEQVPRRLKYPQLLGFAAVLLVLDIFIPDVIPFLDEILLALLTALFAFWRESAPPAKPPEKDVTPRPQISD